MDVSRVTTGDRIVLGAGVLLVIDLVLLPWHQVFSFSTSAIDAPGGWWGTLAVLLTLGVIGLTLVRRLTTVVLPTLPRPIGEASLALTGGVAALLVIKLLLDPDYLGFGSYLGLALAAAMVGGAVPGRHETDEAPPVGTGPGAPPTPF